MIKTHYKQEQHSTSGAYWSLPFIWKCTVNAERHDFSTSSIVNILAMLFFFFKLERETKTTLTWVASRIAYWNLRVKHISDAVPRAQESGDSRYYLLHSYRILWAVTSPLKVPGWTPLPSCTFPKEFTSPNSAARTTSQGSPDLPDSGTNRGPHCAQVKRPSDPTSAPLLPAAAAKLAADRWAERLASTMNVHRRSYTTGVLCGL